MGAGSPLQGDFSTTLEMTGHDLGIFRSLQSLKNEP